jgi:uncharacterized protein
LANHIATRQANYDAILELKENIKTAKRHYITGYRTCSRRYECHCGGGMLVGFPVLISLGIPPLVANATGYFIAIPGQITSLVAYRNYLKKVPMVYAWLLMPLLIGSTLGVLTLRNTSPEDFAQMVPALVGFGVALFAFQPLMHFHLYRHFKGRAKTVLPLILLGLAMLPLGYYGGYFGVGYGFIMLAFLGFTNLHDAHIMNTMKNVSTLCISSASVVLLTGSGLIDLRTGLVMGVGAATGGYLGARYAQRVSSHWLRIIITAIGIGAVWYLALKSY